MTDVVDIGRLLAGAGFTGADAARRARAVLEENGLTRPGKRGIAAEKAPRARGLLASHFLLLCGNAECARIAAGANTGRRDVVEGAQSACEVCGGSNNRRAAQLLTRRLKSERVERLLIVGGTPTLHGELDALLSPKGFQIRYVDGAVGSHSLRDATPNLQWAQVVVIWGSSPLPHKVSKLYTESLPSHVRIVKFARRGIEALCHEVIRSFA